MRLLSFGIQQMDEAVALLEAIESNTGPGCEVILANLVVMDFDPIGKLERD